MNKSVLFLGGAVLSAWLLFTPVIMIQMGIDPIDYPITIKKTK